MNVENQNNHNHNCCNNEECCSHKKKNSIWKQIIFFIVIVSVATIITIKLVNKDNTQHEKCCPHSDTSSCCHEHK